MNVWKQVFAYSIFLSSWSMAAMEFKEADITTVKNIVERSDGSGAVPAKVNDKIHENSKVSTAAASMAGYFFAALASAAFLRAASSRADSFS